MWIGGDPVPYMEQVRSAGLEGRVLFLGNRTESRRYYYVGHIFLLSSREDPCPLVALEAADAGQWRKGLSQARAKYVWVAESDDVAEPAVP